MSKYCKWKKEHDEVILDCLGKTTKNECFKILNERFDDFNRELCSLKDRAGALRKKGVTDKFFLLGEGYVRNKKKSLDKAQYNAPQDDSFKIRANRLRERGLAKSKMENGVIVYYHPRTKKPFSYADLHRLWLSVT